MPIQISVISACVIGFPSVVLAVIPNKNKVKKDFMKNILKNSVANGITVLLLIVILMIVNKIYHVPLFEEERLYVYILSLNGLIVLFQVCKPFNWIKSIVFVLTTLSIFVVLIYFGSLMMIEEDAPIRVIIQMFSLLCVLLLFGSVIDRVIKFVYRYILNDKGANS